MNEQIEKLKQELLEVILIETETNIRIKELKEKIKSKLKYEKYPLFLNFDESRGESHNDVQIDFSDGCVNGHGFVIVKYRNRNWNLEWKYFQDYDEWCFRKQIVDINSANTVKGHILNNAKMVGLI